LFLCSISFCYPLAQTDDLIAQRVGVDHMEGGVIGTRRPSPPPASSPKSGGSTRRSPLPTSSITSTGGVDGTVARALSAGVPRAQPPAPHAFNVFTSTPRYARIISPPITPLTKEREAHVTAMRSSVDFGNASHHHHTHPPHSNNSSTGHTRAASSPNTSAMWASPLPFTAPHQRKWSVAQGRLNTKTMVSPTGQGPLNTGHRRTRSPPQTGGGGDLAPHTARRSPSRGQHTRHQSNLSQTGGRPTTSDSSLFVSSAPRTIASDRFAATSPGSNGTRPSIVPPLRLPVSTPQQPQQGMMSSGFDRLVIRPMSTDGYAPSAPSSVRTPTTASKSMSPGGTGRRLSSRGFPYSSRGVVNRSDAGATNYADRVKDHSDRIGVITPRPVSSRTKIVKHHPAINRPHRVFPPAFMNAPPRTDTVYSPSVDTPTVVLGDGSLLGE
jgi:hypothetical protein